jgi:hypothetical protein
MDNLYLQVTPLELSASDARRPLQLTCLLKKVAITTGHVLEKHELKGHSQQSPSTPFGEGPTFSLSKEFELRNTKVGLPPTRSRCTS